MPAINVCLTKPQGDELAEGWGLILRHRAWSSEVYQGEVAMGKGPDTASREAKQQSWRYRSWRAPPTPPPPHCCLGWLGAAGWTLMAPEKAAKSQIREKADGSIGAAKSFKGQTLWLCRNSCAVPESRIPSSSLSLRTLAPSFPCIYEVTQYSAWDIAAFGNALWMYM